MLVKINNVTKKYIVKENLLFNSLKRAKQKEINALDGISFSLNNGEVLGVIGSNGSGKSTLLKIISRITPPSSGYIKIKGNLLSLLEVGTGFHPELTGRENIFLNGAIIGMEKNKIIKKINNIISFSGINDFIDIPVKKYSSGMYIRLAFSIAAHMNPDILLIDEVLAVGDFDFQKKCIDTINRMVKRENKGAIIVSHNLDVIQNLCNKCLWIRNGKVARYGEANKVIYSYKGGSNENILISKRKDRLGNNKMKVVKVELRNEKKEKVDYFYSGQKAFFYINYEAYDNNINFVDVALPIYSVVLNKRIANIYSKTINKRIDIKGKKGCIKIMIKNLPLNIGKYKFNVWLGGNGEIYDNVINAGSFNVMFGDYYQSGTLPPPEHGVMLLDYEITKY